MRLLVISHTPHFPRKDELVGWEATVRELDYLAGIFSEIVHIAPVHDGPAPPSAAAYAASNVRIVPVPPAGGDSLRQKLGIIARYPQYARSIGVEFASADIVHIRCPSNIGMLGLALLLLRGAPSRRWIKYAGDWGGNEGEPWTYALQRWWLRKGLAKGAVTVNGSWPGQPEHVHSFLNPCLTDEELAAGRTTHKCLTRPVRLLFVGQLIESKGADRALLTLERVRRAGIDATLTIVGDGPQRSALDRQAADLDLNDHVYGEGWLSRASLGRYYREAHFLVLPSQSEGWPKVLSEAMAYGVVPLAGRVGSIGELLGRARVGKALDFEDITAFADSVSEDLHNPQQWRMESDRAKEFASRFTYARYLERIGSLVGLPVDKPEAHAPTLTASKKPLGRMT